MEGGLCGDAPLASFAIGETKTLEAQHNKSLFFYTNTVKN